jgi:hypothetical protein
MNSSYPDATLKKKHVALSYYMVRESVVTGIIHPMKIPGKTNIADLLTKPLDINAFMGHTNKLLYMTPLVDQ